MADITSRIGCSGEYGVDCGGLQSTLATEVEDEIRASLILWKRCFGFYVMIDDEHDEPPCDRLYCG